MTDLLSLYLYNTDVTDLSPIVANTGIGSGDYVYFYDDNFNDATECAAVTESITLIKATGATLYSYCPP